MSLVEVDSVAVVTAQQKHGSRFLLTAPPCCKIFQNPVSNLKKKFNLKKKGHKNKDCEMSKRLQNKTTGNSYEPRIQLDLV
jgi:hypothetical protein